MRMTQYVVTEPRWSYEWIGTSVFEVILVDNRGKEGRGSDISDRVLAQGGGFGDPTR